MNEIVDQCVRVFQDRYGEAPQTVVLAPGRVNLIGEHTDYNEGFVLPAAIDRWIAFAARHRSDNQAHIHAVSFDEEVSFTINRRLDRAGDWGDYARGMVSQFQAANLRIGGFDGVIAGNVPLGAGLSSSAALEMAIGRGLLDLFDIQMTGQRLATIGQAAENQFVGVNCGIMDQFISANGRADHALFLDCRDLSFELVPLATDDVKIVICNSGVTRGLTDSAYNDRRAACEQGVRQLSLATGKALTSLRDVDLEMLEDWRGALTEEGYRRCRHVVAEIARTELAHTTLVGGDLESFGALMRASHESLKVDYEVSGPELDLLVQIAWETPGVLGARMTGAGFGGCTVNLVEADAVDGLIQAVKDSYSSQTDYDAEVYVCRAVNGVGVEKGA
jgi:galactokinase